MSRRAVWLGELSRVVALVAVGAALGSLSRAPWTGVSLMLALRLGMHVHRLAWLRAWLDRPKQVALPLASGIWGDVFDALLNLQKRNRKRKKKLAAIVAEFQLSTEALPDGAVVLAARGEIAWFNKAAQALLGLRFPQDLGLRVPNLVRKPAFTEYFARGEFNGEVEASSPLNPEIMLSYRVIPYGNGQRLLIVRDVSELKRLEIARRDFVANASHELRTPLTVIKGYLEMMEADSRQAQPLAGWRTPISEMRAQSTRMESLVNDLLKLARLESDVIQSRQDLIEIPRLIARIQQEAGAMSRGQHRLQFEADDDLFLYGRETEVQSVLGNLVNNAVHYTPPGGIVNVRWWGDEHGAHFAVADTGIGIEDKDIPRLTERFYRVDVGRSRASGGTGLGLSIVKQALDHHEGRLQIDSEPGVGSTFTAHFPPHRVHRRAAQIERQPSDD